MGRKHCGGADLAKGLIGHITAKLAVNNPTERVPTLVGSVRIRGGPSQLTQLENRTTKNKRVAGCGRRLVQSSEQDILEMSEKTNHRELNLRFVAPEVRCPMLIKAIAMSRPWTPSGNGSAAATPRSSAPILLSQRWEGRVGSRVRTRWRPSEMVAPCGADADLHLTRLSSTVLSKTRNNP